MAPGRAAIARRDHWRSRCSRRSAPAPATRKSIVEPDAHLPPQVEAVATPTRAASRSRTTPRRGCSSRRRWIRRPSTTTPCSSSSTRGGSRPPSPTTAATRRILIRPTVAAGAAAHAHRRDHTGSGDGRARHPRRRPSSGSSAPSACAGRKPGTPGTIEAIAVRRAVVDRHRPGHRRC